MGYPVLRGSFVIRYPDQPRQGPQPDGDTVKFQPDTPGLVDTLPRCSGTPAQINSRGMSVRLEAIDALETHFDNDQQEFAGATAARDALLAQLGFTGVTFVPDVPNNVDHTDQDSVRGHVLSNGIDANGRMIGFIYKGVPAEPDGGQVFLDNPRVDTSVHATLLTAGPTYPAFYDTLPADLRAHLADVSRAARAAGSGSGHGSPPTPTAQQRSPVSGRWSSWSSGPNCSAAACPTSRLGSPTSTDSTPGCARTRSTVQVPGPGWVGQQQERVVHDVITAAGQTIQLTLRQPNYSGGNRG